MSGVDFANLLDKQADIFAKERNDLKARIAALELASVLRDRALESGDFAGCLSEEQRGELFTLADQYQKHGDTNWCGEEHNGIHRQDCALARWLRILGGPEEVARQVDAAWEEALAVSQRRLHGLRGRPASYLLNPSDANALMRDIYAEGLDRLRRLGDEDD